jgi:transcriptional regulator with XRE-family HTH domain
MRLDKRLTQQEVADRLKVSQSYYSSVEAGRKPGEIAMAERVINRMRFRSDRTEGGSEKAGRRK